MGEGKREKAPRRSRGLAPVVGMVFLAGLVILGAAAVFVVGGGALSGMTADADTDQAVTAMTAVSHDLQSRGYASPELPPEGQHTLDPEAGWMRVEVGNETVVTRDEGRLGTYYYRNDDAVVAYQGGGVWRRERGSSATVVESTPPLDYTGSAAESDEPTLTLPVIGLEDANGTVAEGVLSTDETRTEFPGDASVSNPLTEDVTITVHSEFHDGWATYFEETFDAEVTRTGPRTVQVTLDAAGTNRTVREREREVDDDGGIHGFLVNDGGELDVRQQITVDSYDSSEGPYTGQAANSNGDVRSRGDLNVANEMHIAGDVEATGSAVFSGNVEIDGDVAIGDGGTETLVDTNPGAGPVSQFHGTFSTKQDAEVTDGPQFGDDVIVGGDLQDFHGTVDGTMYVHGDVDPGGSGSSFEGEVQGDLVVGGTANLEDAALTVHGDVVTGAADDELRDPIDPVVPTPDPGVDVDQKGTELAADNDNDQTTAIQNGRLQDCGTGGMYAQGCRLGAGSYYLQEVDLDEDYNHYGHYSQPEQLTLDTTGGPIEIYVDGPVSVEDLGSVHVDHGPAEHPVRLYVDGDFDVTRGAEVSIAGDRSPLLEVYMQPSQQWRIEGGSEFAGEVYGLSDGSQRTVVHVSGGSGSTVYGALLGDIRQFDQEGHVHYDEDAGEGTIEPPGKDGELVSVQEQTTDDADVVYLHVDRKDVQAG